MRLVIDMQGAQTESRFRGIGRYSMSLAQAMARHADCHEVWIAVNAQLPENIPEIRAAFNGLVPSARIRVFDAPCNEAPTPWLTRAAEQVREQFIASLAPDVVLVTSVFEGFRERAVTSIGASIHGYRTAAILYDLIPLLNPEQYLPNRELRDHYHRKVGWLKNADLLLAISEHSKHEGIKHLALPAVRIVNISTAIGSQFHPRTLDSITAQALLTPLGINRKIVLYAPGGFDVRKNFDRLIEAYSQLSRTIREAHQLVIVSKLEAPERKALVRMRDRCGLAEDELVLPGYVKDDDLVALYSLATLFVFPSTHEGFGLPVLEAMACGAPVIGADTTSLPEVIGWPDALFDPFSVAAISQKMAQTLTDANFRDRLRSHGLRQAQTFSWDYCARRAWAALEALQSKNESQGAAPGLRPSPSELIRRLAEIRDQGEPTEFELCATARSIAFNSGDKPKQLLLDVSTIVHADAKSGIQRVVRSLLHELQTSPPVGLDVQPIYFDQGIYRYANRFNRILFGTEPTGTNDVPVDFQQDDVYLSLDLNMHLTAQAHGLHRRLQARGISLYFIVYDLLLIHRPDWWPPAMALLFREWLTSISEVATGLVCISRATADELTDWLKLNPPRRSDAGPRVTSFHLGADVDNSLPSRGMPSSSAHVLAELTARNSFLMVGTLEPRKGHAQTLAAFELLWDKGIDANLVIVGHRGWLVDQLIHRLEQHSKMNSRLFWLEGISDEYLEKVYAASTCLIAASEGEGFGLPLIEAAQHKLPVIARDIRIFREVAGSHAYYFDGLAPLDLATAVEQWLSLHASAAHPNSEHLPWLTWKQSAQQLVLGVVDCSPGQTCSPPLQVGQQPLARADSI